MGKTYFVSGIGTDVGKTVASSALVEAMNADYWKPVQSGELDNSDSMKIKSLISNSKTTIHPETYRFELPASPHLSAMKENVGIDLDKFEVPETDNDMVIEGAGGLLVPLSDKHLIIDLIEKLNVPVILVIRSYLGSINHSLLSIEALKSRNIELAGVVYSGSPNAESERIISVFSGVPVLGKLPELSELTAKSVSEAATHIDLSAL